MKGQREKTGATLPFVPYPTVTRHGLVGDRRTAALVANDGTIDWLCLPDFDSTPLFGALLDAVRGGRFRLGPVVARSGAQRYDGDSGRLVTTWTDAAGDLELTDAMAWPEDDRPRGTEGRRCVVRRLRCTRGEVDVALSILARSGFAEPARVQGTDDGACIRVRSDDGAHDVGLWTTMRPRCGEGQIDAQQTLRAGEEAWVVLTWEQPAAAWSTGSARVALEHAADFWRRAADAIRWDGARADVVRRAVMVMRMLTFAPTGAIVAAATAGLPERIGGDRNYDYRFAWVRDASLALGVFATMGDDATAARFFDWLTQLESRRGRPLQVCYGVRGETKIAQHEQRHLDGFRKSRPVIFGNRAYAQNQIGSLGYFADCAYTHLAAGGTWRRAYDDLLGRVADHTCRVWDEPDSGIWELQHHAQYVLSKVMCWVILDRARRVTERTGGASAKERARWQKNADEVRAEVLARGYCDELRCFRQRYGHDSADAAALLVPIMRFLPADDPRVLGTIAHVERRLSIDGHVYRFVPRETTGEGLLPVGAFESSFLPCTFWLATAHALAGHVDEAERAFERANATAGELGLFAEEFDPRVGEQIGNYPQLFTHAECIRAIVEIERARRRGAGKAAPQDDAA